MNTAPVKQDTKETNFPNTDMKESNFSSGRDVSSREIEKDSTSAKHSEGPVAKAIEKQTAKLPSDTFLWLALGAIGASLSFQLAGKKETSTFIGQWAPTLLILGLYNKVVKLQGSEPRGLSQPRTVNA